MSYEFPGGASGLGSQAGVVGGGPTNADELPDRGCLAEYSFLKPDVIVNVKCQNNTVLVLLFWGVLTLAVVRLLSRPRRRPRSFSSTSTSLWSSSRLSPPRSRSFRLCRPPATPPQHHPACTGVYSGECWPPFAAVSQARSVYLCLHGAHEEFQDHLALVSFTASLVVILCLSFLLFFLITPPY